MSEPVEVETKIEKSGMGVIVARFQVDELHQKHLELLRYVDSRSARTLVLLGVAPTLGTAENPLDYATRAHMVLQACPNVLVLPLPDLGDDDRWSQQLDATIKVVEPIGKVTLYGGRDSFIKYYKGRFQTQVLGEEVFGEDTGISGTMERIKVAEQPPLATGDFRRGAIYTAQRQYPKVIATVDIAVVQNIAGKPHVLLGKKAGEDQWRFPGGFSDPTDTSFEEAAARELMEETRIVMPATSLKYLGSYRVNDPRYMGRDRIITSFYTMLLEHWQVEHIAPQDDLCALDWHPLNLDLLEKLVIIHGELLLTLCRHYL